MALTAPSPTAQPSPGYTGAIPTPAAGAAPATPAQGWHGKSKVLPFAVGAVIALSLADTRAAPVVVAVLIGAVIFQLMQL